MKAKQKSNKNGRGRKYLIEYKDDATAFNAQKKGTIHDKNRQQQNDRHDLHDARRKGIPTHSKK
jgi:phosphoribosylaminoimidazole-succinocarboxamide synthase